MRPALLAVALLASVFAGTAVADDPIWTSKPVRVDPAKQNFERLPSETLGLEDAESVSFPRRIEMHDSTSFTADGVLYRLKGLEPLDRQRLCHSQTGARWPCGNQAAIFVSALFRGHTLFCKVDRGQDEVLLSGCRTTQNRIAFEIVSRGFAFPADAGSDLETALAKAKSQRAGVWKDAACSNAAHSC